MMTGREDDAPVDFDGKIAQARIDEQHYRIRTVVIMLLSAGILMGTLGLFRWTRWPVLPVLGFAIWALGGWKAMGSWRRVTSAVRTRRRLEREKRDREWLSSRDGGGPAGGGGWL